MLSSDPTAEAPVVTVLAVEECGTGGTSRGKFTRRQPAFRLEIDSEGQAVAWFPSGPAAEIDLASGHVADYDTGEHLGTAHTFQALCLLVTGGHRYGHTWFAARGHGRGYVPTALAAHGFTPW
jgi:hypothetical protein